jgi:hypothetical protein
MIKFLTKKDLLSLIPFQAASPEDHDSLWPEAYTGDIENIIGLLRQCPSYQIDKNHSHCGLRTRMLPSLEYIRDCMDTGIGIKVMRWKTDRASQTWIPSKPTTNGNGRRPFTVGGEAVGEDSARTFDFTKSRSDIEFGASSLNVDKSAKSMFTADRWNWTAEKDGEGSRPLRTSPSLKF